MPDYRDALRTIHTFPALIKFLRDEMDWPIGGGDFEEMTFEYTAEELGIDAANAAKIQEIKRLRPLSVKQPWGIFFVKFEPRRLPVVALRRILSRVALKKRATASSAERAVWAANDLLFISNFGEGEERQISFAHFSQDPETGDLPTLKVLGWDDLDTGLHLDHVADELRKHLRWPDNPGDAVHWRDTWSAAFTLGNREVITTSKRLAQRLAELARSIRNRVNAALAVESDKGPLRTLMVSFQQALIHDLKEDDFADMYAQTIAYGLLTARVSRPEGLVADNVADMVPITNPFLKELMETFLHLGGRRKRDRDGVGIDFDELGVNDVVEMLRLANMPAVLNDFGDRNPQEDPVIHFYELFLKEYDAKKRMQRGVFYTPRPVVSYIVRSVDELLRSEFGLADGLADTATWGEMAQRHADLKLPEGVKPGDRFVTILDPATGTGTFLVEAIDVIHKTMTAKWHAQGHGESGIAALWNDYVPKSLLPRLHGYELLMAPYAIAHMKIGLKLHETGYRFGSDERARVYLTNSLEPAQDYAGQFAFAIPALAHEAQAVNQVKRDQRFTVVMGNPPYSNFGQLNKNPFILGLLEDYKRGLDEQKINLDDDFVKFIRFAANVVAVAGRGCIGLITNSSYLDGLTHRRMRAHLLAGFNRISLLNLHGSVQRAEVNPSGATDENVFDIKQGVSVAVFAATPYAGKTSVAYADLWGTRSDKYDWLVGGRAKMANWMDLSPHAEYFFLVPKVQSNETEYAEAVSLTDVFSVYQNGIKTDRDDLFFAFDQPELAERMRLFFSEAGIKPPFSDTYRIEDSSSYKLLDRRRRARFMPSAIRSCLYRPFDSRWLYYQGGLTSRPATDVMVHMLERENLALLACRQQAELGFQHIFVTRLISECCSVSLKTREITSVFPLWLASPHGMLAFGEDRSNLTRTFTERLDRLTGTRQALLPRDILQYAYAVFHSPSYRTRYAEFLKIDFPRLPLTPSVDLFGVLARLGGELVALHLMESPSLDRYLTAFAGPAAPIVEKVTWSDDTVWLDKGQTVGFRGVTAPVWNFHIGGYQVCEKWPKDRKGRALSAEDITHYHRIVVALHETIRLMGEIDEVIEAHGGWPGAFSPQPKT